MTVESAAWAVAAYLAGTLPSTLLVARAGRAPDLVAASDRTAGEADPHVLMAGRLGPAWTAAAAGADVAKAALVVLAAREWGRLGTPWLAIVGLAAVAGHAFPFYARRMAGRGLAAAAGVHLVLLPVEMVAAGLVIIAGSSLRVTGLASTLAMALVPGMAAVRGAPPAFVVLGLGVLALLVARRVEGVGRLIREGVPARKAILHRALFDVSPGRADGDGTDAGGRPGPGAPPGPPAR